MICHRVDVRTELIWASSVDLAVSLASWSLSSEFSRCRAATDSFPNSLDRRSASQTSTVANRATKSAAATAQGNSTLTNGARHGALLGADTASVSPLRLPAAERGES